METVIILVLHVLRTMCCAAWRPDISFDDELNTEQYRGYTT